LAPPRTPTETRSALRYVLQNHRTHEARRGEKLNRDWIDPFSSAYWSTAGQGRYG